MYLARYCYNDLPRERERAIAFIGREVEAARRNSLQARLLVPLTRGRGEAALQFEVELTDFDQLESLRHEAGETDAWMHQFSEILLGPPEVTILKVSEPRS
jgi:hypothetical protein